jgi:predicted pyridoxine 5'-phosphate oxidase superfamily flavin-nucleotide-binding protein
VATVNDDGTPNVSPKGTIAALDGDHFIFGDVRSPNTIHNLRVRPKVEIIVLDPVNRKGYRIAGTATVVDQGARFDELMEFLKSRGIISPIQTLVVVAVESAAPIISPVYDRGVTEEQMRARWHARQAELDQSRVE